MDGKWRSRKEPAARVFLRSSRWALLIVCVLLNKASTGADKGQLQNENNQLENKRIVIQFIDDLIDRDLGGGKKETLPYWIARNTAMIFAKEFPEEWLLHREVFEPTEISILNANEYEFPSDKDTFSIGVMHYPKDRMISLNSGHLPSLARRLEGYKSRMVVRSQGGGDDLDSPGATVIIRKPAVRKKDGVGGILEIQMELSFSAPRISDADGNWDRAICWRVLEKVSAFK